MKKLLVTLFSTCSLLLPLTASDFAKNKVIRKVKDHSVAVIVYYAMDAEVYRREIIKLKKDGARYPDVIIHKPEQYISYVGAGTILPDDHVITVNHLLDRISDAYGMHILIQGDSWEHPIKAIIVYCSKNKEFSDDYALLRMTKSPNLPGVKVSDKGFNTGDKYIAVGSSGGFAYLMRFGFIIPIQKFFRRDEFDELKIGKWENFPYTTIYPGAPGDSGGGVFNKKGELVTMMYCGVPDRPYVFCNPNEMLQKFLIEHGFHRFIKGYNSDD